jgi:type VI protein secretion system component VasK
MNAGHGMLVGGLLSEEVMLFHLLIIGGTALLIGFAGALTNMLEASSFHESAPTIAWGAVILIATALILWGHWLRWRERQPQLRSTKQNKAK